MKFFIKLFFFSILLIVSINLKSFAEKKIISGMIITKADKMATKSPDKNFLKKLTWQAPYSKKNFRTIIEDLATMF